MKTYEIQCVFNMSMLNLEILELIQLAEAGIIPGLRESLQRQTIHQRSESLEDSVVEYFLLLSWQYILQV